MIAIENYGIQITPGSANLEPRQQLTLTATLAANWTVSPAGWGTVSPATSSTTTTYTPPDPLRDTRTVTITATDPANSANTGSMTINFVSPVLTLNPVVGSGGSGFTGNFGFSGTDNNPAGISNTVAVALYGAFVPAGSLDIGTKGICTLAYAPLTQTNGANAAFLLNDDGSSWQTGTVGTSAELSNSQCSMSLLIFSAGISSSGTLFTLFLDGPVHFAASYAGNKDIVELLWDTPFATGVAREGTWTVQ